MDNTSDRDAELKELREFVIEQDKLTEERIMARLTRILLFQLMGAFIPAAVVIWQLAGIYTNANSSLDLLRSQQHELQDNRRWMQERERWEYSVELWGKDKGYVPPEYHGDMQTQSSQ